MFKFLISFLFSLNIIATSPYPIRAGGEIIDFKLKNQDGKSIDTKSFRGKYLILEWYNHGCPFVRKHYDSGNMQKTQEFALSQSDTVWLTINSSNVGKQGHLKGSKEAKERLRIEKSNANHLLLDTNGKVGKSYLAKTTPEIFIIDPKGKIIYLGAIDSIPSADSRDIGKATNYVREMVTKIRTNKEFSPKRTKPYGCSIKY